MNEPLRVILVDEPIEFASIPSEVYVNAHIRAVQWDALNEKLDRILRQQAIIMEKFGMRPDGSPAPIKA